MKKYTAFDTHKGRVIILTASITGFRNNPQVVWTDVILDSGALVGLNGVEMEDAIKIYEEALKEK